MEFEGGNHSTQDYTEENTEDHKAWEDLFDKLEQDGVTLDREKRIVLGRDESGDPIQNSQRFSKTEILNGVASISGRIPNDPSAYPGFPVNMNNYRLA